MTTNYDYQQLSVHRVCIPSLRLDRPRIVAQPSQNRNVCPLTVLWSPATSPGRHFSKASQALSTEEGQYRSLQVRCTSVSGFDQNTLYSRMKLNNGLK